MKYRSNCLTFYLVKSHPKTLIFLINGRPLICADTVGTINLHIVFHKICLIIFKNPLSICLPILSLDPCLGMLLVKFSSPFVMSILKSHYNPKIVMMMMTVAHFIDGWFGCQNAHYGATQKAFFFSWKNRSETRDRVPKGHKSKTLFSRRANVCQRLLLF